MGIENKIKLLARDLFWQGVGEKNWRLGGVRLKSGDRDIVIHCLLVLNISYVKELQKKPIPLKELDVRLQNFLRKRLLPKKNDQESLNKATF